MHEDISVCSQTRSSPSLRDAEWRQLCRHSALRHSSLLPQSLCGRRVSSRASALRGAGSALVGTRDLWYDAHVTCLRISSLLFVALLHGRGRTCSCDDVSPPFEPGSLLCLSWHVCDFDNLPPPPSPPHPARSCCHMLPGFCLCCAGATSPQRIVARWIRSADGTCFSSAQVFSGGADCPLLTAHNCRETTG